MRTGQDVPKVTRSLALLLYFLSMSVDGGQDVGELINNPILRLDQRMYRSPTIRHNNFEESDG